MMDMTLQSLNITATTEKTVKKNLEDMKREYKQQHGFTRYQQIKKFSCIGKIDD